MTSSDDEKDRIRSTIRASLRSAGGEHETVLCDRLFREIMDRAPSRVACVWPLPGELDLRSLCHRLHDHGVCVLLPETTPKGNPLIFRQWQPDCVMNLGRFGTSYPDGAEAIPDLILVPLLAFDRRGTRLGYGGGYYDRTLARFAVPAMGYGLACQEHPHLPTGPYDVPLPMIVTERETIHVFPPAESLND